MDRLDTLFVAAIAGNADAVARLGIEADKLNEDGETILHVESERGNTGRVRFILKEFANKNLLLKTNKYERTALHLAAMYGKSQVAEVLIDAARHLPTSSAHDDNPVTSFQAFLRQADKFMETALHLAVMKGNVDIVKVLVEADPNDRHIQNDEGKTPMYIAVEQGFNYIVEIISTICTAPSLDGPHCNTVVRIKNLEEGKNPAMYKIMDGYAFFVAATTGDADAMAKLEMQADILNGGEETIIQVESQNRYAERLRFILREFAKKNLLATLITSNYRTALHLAAMDGHTDVAEILIDAATHLPPSDNAIDNPVTSFQAFLRQPDEYHRDTALHLAVEFGHTSIVKLLVEADPTDTHIQNMYGQTPMYIAVEKGFNDIVEIISSTCTAPSLDGPHGGTAVREIMNLDEAKSTGGTLYKIMDKDALYAAAIAGDAAAIAGLEIQSDRLTQRGETILHIESMAGNTEHVRFIVRVFASKNLLVKLNGYKWTALHWAAHHGHTEVAEVLIDAARHLPPSSNDDSTHDNPVTSFQAFLRKGDVDMHTALHIAVLKGNVAIVKLLVEADPTDRHIQNNHGNTPMYIAVEKGFNDIVEIISTICTAPSLDGPHGGTAVREIKNLDEAKSAGGTLYKIMGKDALYAAAIAGDAAALAGLEIQSDRLTQRGETILHIESMAGNTKHVRFIVRVFASKNLLVKLDNQEKTALTYAAYYGHTEVVKVLIDAARHMPPPPANDKPITSFQAFLRHADKYSETALHAAVKEGHANIAKLLVEADPSDRHVPNRFGITPMYIAVEKGYHDIVKVMCTTCTAPSLEGPGRSTTLHTAIRHLNHDIEVVMLLIGAARNLPPWYIDEYGFNSRLDEASYSPDDDEVDSVTAFHDFLWQGDEDWNTALHIAVMQGYLDTAKLLVEASPSYRVHTRNKKGETPIYIAAERGYHDIMKMICTTAIAPLNLDSPDGSKTLLHVTINNLHKAKKDDITVIRICIEALLENPKGSSLFDETDEYKRTILELAVEGNHVNVVELILKENPKYHVFSSLGYDYDLISLVPLIYKALDKDYRDIVKLLTDTHQTGAKMCLSSSSRLVIELIFAIGNRNIDYILNLLDGPNGRDLVTKADNLGWTPLHHAVYHQFDSIINRIIEVQKLSGYQFVYEEMVPTPLLIAAEKGYTSTLKYLMESWPSSSSACTSLDRNGQNILHLAALQSRKEMIQNILNQCPERYKNEIVNKQDNNGNTTLHILVSSGCFVPEFIKFEGLDITLKNKERLTPKDMLYSDNQIIGDQVQIKIELDKIQTKHKLHPILESIVLPNKLQTKDAMFIERLKEELETYKISHMVAQLFVDAIKGHPIARAALEMEADKPNQARGTILHVESKKGDIVNVRFILEEFANKNLLVKLDRLKQTALHLAAQHGHTQVVEVLIDAARRNLPSSAANHDDPISSFYAFIRQATAQKRNTALHKAVHKGNLAIVKLLLEADPSDRHIPNVEGKTPIYMAAEKGYKSIIKEICTTCTAQSLEGPDGRTTALHAFVRNIKQVREGANDVIRMMVDATKRWSNADDASLVNLEALFGRRDESGSTVLELAMERNYVDAVKLLLLEDPAYQLGGEIKRNGLMRLINKAIDDKYSDDIVELLCKTYQAGIHPDQQNVLALILAIKKRDEETVSHLPGELKHLVTFTEDNGWTPLHYAAYHEFDSIIGTIIEAQEKAGHQFVYANMVETPFHVAVKHGYTSTVIRLMQSWPAPSSAVTADNSPYTAVDEFGRNILHLAAANNNKAADNNKEMVQGILKYCPKEYKDTILKQQDNDGNTPLHLLISYGCFIPELINHNVLDTMAKNKNNFTPRDMLYFQNDVVADQVHIKIALDHDVKTNQSAWNLWAKSKDKKTEDSKSTVPPSKRRIKDVIFDARKISVKQAKHKQKKEDLERYKMRTNTQIIVTALITTVTFTVGFTMPGGLRQSGEVDEGLVLLSKKKAFNAFMVSDALALLLSTTSLFFYFLESMNEDPSQVAKLNAASTVLNIISVMAMMLTFIAGTYLVLSNSPAIAISVCVIGSLFFLIIIVLLIKIVCDRQVKRNED